MDPKLITLLVQVVAEEAPAVIAAIHDRGGSVRNVGPMLQQDAAIIDADIAQLKGELDPPPAP